MSRRKLALEFGMVAVLSAVGLARLSRAQQPRQDARVPAADKAALPTRPNGSSSSAVGWPRL